jgi:hypothetical protein
MSFKEVFRMAKPMRKAGAPELEDMGGGRAASRQPPAQANQTPPALGSEGSSTPENSFGAGRRIVPAMSDVTGATGRKS